MSTPVRVNDELYELLGQHAEADGRSVIKELEIILALYFDGIDNPTPKTDAAIRRKDYDKASDDIADTVVVDIDDWSA